MENSKRLSLDDFQLENFDSNNEIEKLMGLAAADCHKTCNPDKDASWLDWVDYSAAMEAPDSLSLSAGPLDLTLA